MFFLYLLKKKQAFLYFYKNMTQGERFKPTYIAHRFPTRKTK